MIELSHVSKQYKTKNGIVNALKDCNLTINDGEIFGIIGYSGAGKSTLLRLINQLETQTSGDVKIDGRNLACLSKKELRQQRTKIGMIFQHFNLLWSRTILENIELPLEIVHVNPQERRQKALELIELVGLKGRENAYPNQLSGGQKQRVGIARALANDPTILLCDEATSALDPETTESILDLLVKINQKLNITIVLITHQMEVVQSICHRIAIMSEGEIVEIGSVDDIFEHPKHPVSQRFVHGVSSKVDDHVLKEELKQIYPNGVLLRLTFNTSICRQPILSQVMKATNVAISIVHANLTNTHDHSFGVMYVNLLDGTQNEYEQVIEQLVAKQVIVEVV